MKNEVKHILKLFTLFIVFVWNTSGLYAQNEEAEVDSANALIDLTSELIYANPDTCIIIIDDIMAIGKKYNIEMLISKSFDQLGSVYFLKDNLDSAKKYYGKAIEMRLQSQDSSGLARAYNNLGLLHYNFGDLQQAIVCMNKSLEMKYGIGDSASAASTLNNIGLLYKEQANYSLAMKYYYESYLINQREIAKDSAFRAVHYAILNCINLGTVYDLQYEYDKAIEFYEEGLRYCSIHDDKKSEAILIGNIGIVFRNKHEFQKALDYYFKALALDEASGNQIGQSNNHNNIALVYMDLGKYEESLEEFYKSLKLVRNIGYIPGQASTLNNIAEVKIKLKHDYKDIESVLQESLKMSKEMESVEDQKRSHFLLSDIYEQQGQFEGALQAFKLATQLKDSIFSEGKSKEIGKIEAQYEFERNQEEEERAQQLAAEKEKQVKQRRDNLQYSGIFIVVLVLFGTVFLTGRFKVSEKVAEGLIFFTFLLFFEFLLVLLDPTIESWSGGEPAYKLVLNAVLAALIFPAHAFFESTLKKRLVTS